MRSLVACLIVVALSGSAFAQAPGASVPLPTPAPTDLKDPSTAVLLSLAVPTVGLATTIIGAENGSSSIALVGVGAMYLGPSLGRWYAGDSGAGSLALRTVAGVSIVAGFGIAMAAADCEGVGCSDRGHGSAGAALFLGGLGVWVGTSLYDIVMAKRAADDWNHRHDQAAMQLKPTMTSVAGHHVMGLELAGHF
jgi:hypothetical protein